MKTLIAHRVSGEDIKTVEKLCSKVAKSLNNAGVDNVYCTTLDANCDHIALGPRATMKYVFKHILECDFLFVLMTSEEKSEGLLMEVGLASGNNLPIIVAVKNGIKNTFVPQMADLVIEWGNESDLCQKVESTDFDAICKK